MTDSAYDRLAPKKPLSEQHTTVPRFDHRAEAARILLSVAQQVEAPYSGVTNEWVAAASARAQAHATIALVDETRIANDLTRAIVTEGGGLLQAAILATARGSAS